MMDYGRVLERAMAMDDTTWARHANPWSVWTRVPILPALALAIYSRAWIGGGRCSRSPCCSPGSSPIRAPSHRRTG